MTKTHWRALSQASAGFHKPIKHLIWGRHRPCRPSVGTGDGPQITVQLLTREGSPTIEHVRLQDDIEAAICHALGDSVYLACLACYSPSHPNLAADEPVTNCGLVSVLCVS